MGLFDDAPPHVLWSISRALQRLSQLAADDLLTCDADGTPSRWQPAGRKLQAAVLRLVEDGDTPTAADATEAPGARALATYKWLLQATLKAYSTTAAEDRAMLEGGGDAASKEMPPRTRLALQFRLSQKVMLNSCVVAAVDAGAAGMTDAAKKLRPSADGLDDAFDFSLTDLNPLK